MSELLRSAALVAATITTGLTAGLFYGWACSVMLGLQRTDDRTFVVAMQRMNTAIINGWFMACFLGAPLLIALAAVLHLTGDGGWSVPAWTAAGFVLYAAVLAVTFSVNVPLNNELDAVGDSATGSDLAAARDRFEARWVRWNVVRAVAATAAFGCLTWALVLHGKAAALGWY